MTEFLIENRVMILIWVIGYWITMTALLVRSEENDKYLKGREWLAAVIIWPSIIGVFMGQKKYARN